MASKVQFLDFHAHIVIRGTPSAQIRQRQGLMEYAGVEARLIFPFTRTLSRFRNSSAADAPLPR